MKRLIFLLIAFACGLTASIASDVGSKHADYLQNPFVITQITPMPVMAVTFEPATAVYNFTQATVPATQTMSVQTFKLDTWKNPDYGPSLAISCNSNLTKFKDVAINLKHPMLALNSTRINRTPDNYNINYSYGLRN